MPESIGPVRWRLQMLHLGLADYRHLQRLVLRQYVRRSSRTTRIAVCAAIGLAIGLLPSLAAGYWDVWLDGSVAVGIGRRPLLILEDDRFRWAALALALVGAAGMWLYVVASYRWLMRRLHDTARRTTPHWSLEVGEDGLHMVLNEVTVTIPWTDVRGLQSSRTASFLTLRGYFKALGISHAGFATDVEREACLAFMTAKIPPTKT